MAKTAAVAEGAWLANFKAQPVLWLLPALGLLLPLIATVGMRARREGGR